MLYNFPELDLTINPFSILGVHKNEYNCVTVSTGNSRIYKICGSTEAADDLVKKINSEIAKAYGYLNSAYTPENNSHPTISLYTNFETVSVDMTPDEDGQYGLLLLDSDKYVIYPYARYEDAISARDAYVIRKRLFDVHRAMADALRK